jgi:hypothetical protein
MWGALLELWKNSVGAKKSLVASAVGVDAALKELCFLR